MPVRLKRWWVWLAGSLVVVWGSLIGYDPIWHHFIAMRSHTPTMDRLNQIGTGVYLFSQDHHGAYPESLPALAKAENLAVDLSLCPDDDGDTDPRWTYVYVGSGLTAVTAGTSTVVAHEPPAFFDGLGCNVLFGDGHMEWVWAADLPAVLARGGPTTAPATRPATTPAR